MSESAFLQLEAILRGRYPNYVRVWEQSRLRFGAAWEAEISGHITRVFGPAPDEKWDEAVDGYAEFCTEALRAQVFFEKHGRYRASNYAEVVRECYHSPDYMQRRYLPGQYLSHFIWPHHRRMLRHFLDDLLPSIASEVSLFYEVGVGCGMYSQKTLERLPDARGVGCDISDYALDFTARVVRAHGFGDRYGTLNQDIIAKPVTPAADLVICQEVLEHLEDPSRFIDALHGMTRPGGAAYITAAINAGHTDHIYLYRNAGEVRAQVEAAGFRVLDEQLEAQYPEKPENFRPTIAGFWCRRLT